MEEYLCINGEYVLHNIFPIIGDGACLFRSLSFVMYGTELMSREVRELIVSHVVENWERFAVMSHDQMGDNYSSSAQYHSEMSILSTYGSSCELEAAGELFNFVFEVYHNGDLCYSFGSDGNPIRRLRFTSMSDHSNGHFDAYYISQESEDILSLPQSTSHFVPLPNPNKATKRRRSRCTHTQRKQQLKKAASKYAVRNPAVNRTAVAKYQKVKPEVHRAAVAQYQQVKPEVHRAAQRQYEKNNPGKRVERQTLLWKVKMNSGLAYDPDVAYEADSMVALGTMSHKCPYCDALKWRDEASGMCCSGGKVNLPPFEPLPEPLNSLIMGRHPEHLHFMERVRKYNGCFQMTSFGAKQVVMDGFMPTFKVQGQVYHLIGSLFPPSQKESQFLQIFFVGEDEKEVRLRCSKFPDVKQELVKQLQVMINEVNSYIKNLKTTLDKLSPTCNKFEVVIQAEKKPAYAHGGRFNAPTTNEIALVMVGQQFEQRDILLQSHDNKLQRISEIHRSYDALQYPLLFCRGEDGYSIGLAQRDPKTKLAVKKTISALSFYCYRIMVRKGEDNHLLYFRSLFSQFLVDMFAKIETERLNYIKFNQAQLRADNYIHLKDSIGKQDADATQLGQKVVLPSSFTGGPRYMHERTQDAMTYVRHYGRPDLFITFTCNPRWPDITDALLPGQKSHDRHDIIARVFHLKVKKIMNILNKGSLFGAVRCFMFSVEWQKRGLPHVHILLWLEKRISPDMIDNIICAEIPNRQLDPYLYEIVKTNMIHGPCGNLKCNSPCMKDGSCSKKYPRQLLSETQTGNDGYPQYRRRSSEDGGFTVKVNGMLLDNSWVVPYNPVLLRTFNAHINVEYCSSVKSIKYICKYVNKGSDQAAFGLENENDEVKLYECGRYLSSSEAAWRIFSFPIHERYPTVFHLAVHLENGQRMYFTSKNLAEKLKNPPQTTLLAFFQLCKIDDYAKTLLYSEVPSYFLWTNNKFTRRKRGKDVDGWPGVKKDSALGRVYTIHPKNVECYHLRLLLHEVRGPTCFSDLKTVNGILHPTFQSACMALGLLEDDKQWDFTLEEAALCDSSFKLRELFTVMLIHCNISDPLGLWEKYKDSLSEDITYQVKRQLHSNVQPVMNEIHNRCLVLIEDAVLSLGGQDLAQYSIPRPKRSGDILYNRDYMRETSYDKSALIQVVSNKEKSLTDEQFFVYQQVLASIQSGVGRVFFLDSPGGTGKTFLINLLLAKVRSDYGIALAVASSGIAATLLEGGKTAHSTFKLPFNLIHSETAMCNITKQSNMAQVLRDCKLIVWDESTMAHKEAFEALNRTLKDIRENNGLMGEVTVLLAGDFRQTLPVVPRGTRADQVKACIKASYLWPLIARLSLRKNMRVHLMGDVSGDQFSQILLKIGDGEYPESEGKVTISAGLGSIVTTLADLTARIYPDVVNIKEKSMDWLSERAILTPKNDRADDINESLMKRFEASEMTYMSVDSVVHMENAVHYPVEFLNTLNPPGLTSHKLHLKVGAPVMLLRNLNPPKLCNGTRLKITALQKNVIEAVVITGCGKGESVFIPRIPLIPSDYPFQFRRLQFPLKICFAMTINKSQGQSLKVAGIDLREDCFSHGQFYVACSRVSSSSSLTILTAENKTTNVVFKEVLK